MASINDVTGDKLQSKLSNDNYRSNFDVIFRKKPNTEQSNKVENGERTTAEGEQGSSKEV